MTGDPVTCPSDPVLVEFADATLDELRALLLIEHLRGCPRCQARVGQHVAVARWLAIEMGARPLPATGEAAAEERLRKDRRAVLEQVTDSPSQRRSRPGWMRSRTWLPRLACAAGKAAWATVRVGWLLHRRRRGRRPARCPGQRAPRTAGIVRRVWVRAGIGRGAGQWAPA
ncbi:MAG: zf-HC2 domain-containing protein [Bacillota bacterium]